MSASVLRSCVSRAALALLLGAPGLLAAQATRSAYEELQTFSGVLNHIRINYPDSVGYSDLVAAAIRGVLRALDPHSSYLSRVEWERRSALERGELFTVGLSLAEVEGAVTVLGVAAKGPAARGGILPGDRIKALNDSSVDGVDVRAVELRLAGDKGSKVRLRMERGSRFDPDTFQVTLRRADVERHSVSRVRMLDATTGYLHLDDFLGEASDEVHDALRKLKSQRAQQVILDLRGNPGGSVVAAVEIASEFLPKGTVVFRTKGRKRDVDTTYVTKRDGEFRTLPLIVLINEGSASASEALAGSLQDHDRALVIGRRSFGKALMQTLFFLPHGDNVMLTVGRVLTPNGRFIQRRYRGLAYEQYLSFAGKSGAEEDTSTVYRTDRGRAVRGGGGIAPDIAVARPTQPAWWGAATDSGYHTAVADSAANTLDASAAGRVAWIATPEQWRGLVPPFLARVRAGLGVAAQADSATERVVSRLLAARATEVRWGADALDEFLLRTDTTVQLALTSFPRLDALLATPAR